MKKLFIMFLTFTLLCSILFSINISSYEAKKSGNFQYTLLKNGTAKVIYIGTDQNLIIPKTIDGYKITVFDYTKNENITSVTIPPNIHTLCYGAFNDCDSLKTVTLSSGLKTIESSAFENCSSLTEITIPGSVNNINNYAFSYCTSLKSVVIQDGVKDIKDEVFSFCKKLTNISIPDSVTHVGEDAFLFTPWFKKQPNGFVFAGKNLYKYKGKCPSKLTIPEGTKSICSSAFGDDYSFYGSNLQKVSIPDSVITIGFSAFAGCDDLKKVKLGKNITSIGAEAFSTCQKLAEIEIPNTVTKIGFSAFAGCEKLRYVTIGKGLRKLGNSDSTGSSVPFSGCENLKKFKVHKENKYFSSKNGVLFNKSQTELVAYPNKKSTSYSIPKGVKIIKAGAFYMCNNLKKVVFPKTLVEIKYAAFMFSSIRIFKAPDNLKFIRPYAFYGCDYLEKAVISKKLQKIGNNAFSGCSKLKKLTFNATNCKFGVERQYWDNSLIFGSDKNLKTIIIGKNVKNVPADLFNDVIALNLNKVVIHKNIKSISVKAFDRTKSQNKKPLTSSDSKVISITQKGNLTLEGNGVSTVTFKCGRKKRNVTFVVTS